ncbi:MAG: transglycosylase SLT domain-containing protein [Candidatus Nanopelagicaceae bacterium]
MKIDRFYQTLVRRRGRAAWTMVGAMIVLSTATPSSYGLEFPMTTQLTIPNGAYLVASQVHQENPEQQVAALYANLNTKKSVSAIDLRAVSLASRQIELARTPKGAQQAAFNIIRTEYKKWNKSQEACLVKLWTRESHWNYKAHNYRSGAHGIAQSYPAIKMESVGLDWRTNPVTQIRWGLNYIDKRYGSPCKALYRHNVRGSY